MLSGRLRAYFLCSVRRKDDTRAECGRSVARVAWRMRDEDACYERAAVDDAAGSQSGVTHALFCSAAYDGRRDALTFTRCRCDASIAPLVVGFAPLRRYVTRTRAETRVMLLR